MKDKRPQSKSDLTSVWLSVDLDPSKYADDVEDADMIFRDMIINIYQ